MKIRPVASDRYYQHTRTLQNPHIHAPHITKQVATATLQGTSCVTSH